MGTRLTMTFLNGKNISSSIETWPNPLPCPFCASKEVLWQNNYQPYSVFCRDCGARIESKGDKRLCIEKWNRRANYGKTT